MKDVKVVLFMFAFVLALFVVFTISNAQVNLVVQGTVREVVNNTVQLSEPGLPPYLMTANSQIIGVQNLQDLIGKKVAIQYRVQAGQHIIDTLKVM